MRGSVRQRWLAATCVAVLTASTGCGPAPRPDLKSAPAVSATVRVPAGGFTLAQIGIVNGPAAAFSVPSGVAVTTSVDQPSGVTLVFGYPSPRELAAYLRRVLPESGFVVTGDDPATATLTFTGYGWHGSFTGTGATSAVILRP